MTKLPTLNKNCAICNAPFLTKRDLTLTCGYECSEVLRERRRRERYQRSKAKEEEHPQ